MKLTQYHFLLFEWQCLLYKPMMVIQGGIDFRVGYEQGQEAFQAAKLKGLKTKFLYFPNENHWVLHPQNGLVWQREFFDWLKETL